MLFAAFQKAANNVRQVYLRRCVLAQPNMYSHLQHALLSLKFIVDESFQKFQLNPSSPFKYFSQFYQLGHDVFVVTRRSS